MEPTPTIAPVMVWVVLTGMPAIVAPMIEQVSDENLLVLEGRDHIAGRNPISAGRTSQVVKV